MTAGVRDACGRRANRAGHARTSPGRGSNRFGDHLITERRVQVNGRDRVRKKRQRFNALQARFRVLGGGLLETGRKAVEHGWIVRLPRRFPNGFRTLRGRSRFRCSTGRICVVTGRRDGCGQAGIRRVRGSNLYGDHLITDGRTLGRAASERHLEGTDAMRCLRWRTTLGQMCDAQWGWA